MREWFFNDGELSKDGDIDIKSCYGCDSNNVLDSLYSTEKLNELEQELLKKR